MTNNSFKTQLNVLHALILREMTGRYGTSHVGYLWAIISPMASLFVLYLLYSVVRGSTADMPLLLFVVTGWVTYDFYQQLMSKLGAAVDANKGLLMHPHVTRLDVLAARAVLESLTIIVMLLIFSTLSFWIEGSAPPDNIVRVAASFATAGFFGISLGVLLSALKTYFPFFENFIAPINRIGLLVSGVIFLVRDLPSWTHPILKWNPMIHPIEGMRDGWFASYESPILDLGYPLSIASVALVLGLMIERRSRHQVVLS